MTPTCAQKFQKSCKFSLPRQFLIRSADRPSDNLTVFVCSGLPAWKRLINYPLSTDERTSLLTYIFADRNGAEAVGHLFGDDAQAFIDVVDEVSVYILLPRRTVRLTSAKTFAPCGLDVG